MAAVHGINFESFSAFVDSVCTEFNDGINKVCEFSNAFFSSEPVQYIGGFIIYAGTAAACFYTCYYFTVLAAPVITPLAALPAFVMSPWYIVMSVGLTLLWGIFGAVSTDKHKTIALVAIAAATFFYLAGTFASLQSHSLRALANAIQTQGKAILDLAAIVAHQNG